MRHCGAASGWFATLRRDRRLFALAATLLLCLDLFQPVATAHAGGAAGTSICTLHADPARKQPPTDSHDCLQCLGACCTIAFKSKAVVAEAVAAWSGPLKSQGLAS